MNPTKSSLKLWPNKFIKQANQHESIDAQAMSTWLAICKNNRKIDSRIRILVMDLAGKERRTISQLMSKCKDQNWILNYGKRLRQKSKDKKKI